MLVSQRVGYTTILRRWFHPGSWDRPFVFLRVQEGLGWFLIFVALSKIGQGQKQGNMGVYNYNCLVLFVPSMINWQKLNTWCFFVGSFSSLELYVWFYFGHLGVREQTMACPSCSWRLGGCVSGDLGKLPSRVGVSVRSNHPAFRSLALKRWWILVRFWNCIIFLLDSFYILPGFVWDVFSFYHGKSLLNQHVGEYCLLFQASYANPSLTLNIWIYGQNDCLFFWFMPLWVL